MIKANIIAFDDSIHEIVRDEILKYGNDYNLNHINFGYVIVS
jgi:hypothetical protein